MLKRYSKYMSLEEFRLRLGFKNFQKKVSSSILVKGFPIRFIITFLCLAKSTYKPSPSHVDMQPKTTGKGQ